MANTATSVVQQRNSDMVELLKPDFVTRRELTYTSTLAVYQALPCLRFLGAGGLGSAGEWRDLSGNGMHLTYNGNPVMSYTTQGAPFWGYDGVGDYHSHADDAHFQITGTETTVTAAVRGMTMGAWIYFYNAAGSTEAIMTKYGAAGARSYYLVRNAAGNLVIFISTDGTAVINCTNGALAQGTWYFAAMRFIPSISLDLFRNDTETNQAVGVPASIFNGTAPFNVAAQNGGNLMSGRVALPFVCACALSDAQITRLYNRSRGLFGV